MSDKIHCQTYINISNNLTICDSIKMNLLTMTIDKHILMTQISEPKLEQILEQTKTPSPSLENSDIENYDLASSTELSNNISNNISDIEEQTDQIDNQKNIPNCKRCGIIFVDIQFNETFQEPKNLYKEKREYGWYSSRRRTTKIHSFLVVRGRSSNIWSFPKGRTLHDKEDEYECAKRELFEETGIHLDPTGLPKITIGRNVYFIYHCNKNDYKLFNIQDSYEVGEVAWKTISELREYKCNKDLRAVLGFPRHNPQNYDIVYKRPSTFINNKCIYRKGYENKNLSHSEPNLTKLYHIDNDIDLKNCNIY